MLSIVKLPSVYCTQPFIYSLDRLLAKMDGVDGLGVPTLLIGLTNKPSLIDSALMRPGRFEVQIEGKDMLLQIWHITSTLLTQHCDSPTQY